jgi:hypothetical protein
MHRVRTFKAPGNRLKRLTQMKKEHSMSRIRIRTQKSPEGGGWTGNAGERPAVPPRSTPTESWTAESAQRPSVPPRSTGPSENWTGPASTQPSTTEQAQNAGGKGGVPNLGAPDDARVTARPQPAPGTATQTRTPPQPQDPRGRGGNSQSNASELAGTQPIPEGQPRINPPVQANKGSLPGAVRHEGRIGPK